MKLTPAQLSDEMLVDAVRQILIGKGAEAEREAVLAEVRRRAELLTLTLSAS